MKVLKPTQTVFGAFRLKTCWTDAKGQEFGFVYENGFRIMTWCKSQPLDPMTEVRPPLLLHSVE